MGRDTIQLETAVSTISQEYLLEFTSEYGISEDLHPELPAPGDKIMDFLEDKIGVYTKFFEFANFRRIDPKILPEDDVNPHFLPAHPRAAHEVPLLTVTENWVIDMDEPAAATESSGTPSTIERSPLDFANENPSQQINEGDKTEDQFLEIGASEVPPIEHASTTGVSPNIVIEEEDVVDVPLVRKRRHKRVNDRTNTNAPPKVLRKDIDVSRPAQSTFEGKSFASTGLEAGSTLFAPASQGTPAGTIDPDQLSFAKPQPAPTRDIAEYVIRSTISLKYANKVYSLRFIFLLCMLTVHMFFVLNAGLLRERPSRGIQNLRSLPPFAGSPGGIYQPGWGITNICRFDTPGSCQDAVDHMVLPGYFSELRHLPNEEFLNQYNVNLARQVAMGSQLQLRFEQEESRDPAEAEVDMKKAAEANNTVLTIELESLRAKFADQQVNNNQLFQQVSTRQAQVTGEEQIKAAFKEFKKHEDDKVERRCAEMDARLDALSIDFDEELYPHMLTAIAGRRWVIGHFLHLAVMKCMESTYLRQAFANIVSAGIAKGMSEGLKHGVEHEKVQLDLEVIKAYDPEANTKYVAALHALKDVKYPLIDHLEKLKDAPIDLIMTSLHLESDVGEETPQWIRELRPSSSHLKIPVYPKVRDPRDPWVLKEEMMLEDAVMANVSRAKKNKKYQVVCRTYEIGSAHHPRSNGILVSAPTIAPQGLAILLTDVDTRTKITGDEASPRLIRSKSLPPMYNLDWP
ncbi:hypothetical protein Tco_1510070 [Tanacetum coccineum]